VASNSWIFAQSAPLSSRCVANEWRRACGLMSGFPARPYVLLHQTPDRPGSHPRALVIQNQGWASRLVAGAFIRKFSRMSRYSFRAFAAGSPRNDAFLTAVCRTHESNLLFEVYVARLSWNQFSETRTPGHRGVPGWRGRACQNPSRCPGFQ